MRLAKLLTVPLLFGLVFSCASPRSVTRTAADAQFDLSGRWNDTDSRIVAESMISDLMRRPWLENFERGARRRPVVIVGTVRNLSSEHINTNPFITDIERELVNSGRVSFVAAAKQREEIRAERLDQQTAASEATIRRLGQETGADFMLQGTINSTVDAIQGVRAVAYQINLELINIETNEKAWIGTEEIKKLIEQSRTRW